MEKKYEKVPGFNPHGAECKGHANFMLDCEFTEKEDRDLMVRVLDNYITNEE